MEAFAVAELLWDLADDTPTEPFSPIVYKGPLDRLAQLLVEDLAVVSAKDQINLGAPGVVRLLFSDKAQTVADAYDILKATDNLAATLRQPSLDLNGDGTADISALDSVFLAHGFHAMRSGSEWIYRVGDPFGETTYGSGDGNLDTPRRAFAPPPGAAIRLNNPSAAAVTFTLRIDNGTTSQEFEVDVAPTSSLTLALLLPPYSRALAQAGAELPACGADDEQRVTLTVSGGGIADRTIDNCEYLHAVAAAPADVALAFGDELPSPTANDGLPGPTPTPTPTAQAPGQAADSTPLLIGGIILLAAVAGLAGWLILRRRK
jgi:hypothetical protein